MKKKILLIVFLVYFQGFSQTDIHFFDSLGYDSLHRKQGYWKLITVLNYVNKKGVYLGVEGWEYGLYNDDKKEGGWIVKDNKGTIIGYRIYFHDSLISEIQIKNRRVRAILRDKITSIEKQEYGVTIFYGKFIEILIFNRKGRLIKYWFQDENGNIIEERL